MNNKKKIGLVSVPRYFNYGSQFQLFALQSAIEQLGYHCEVINYKKGNLPRLSTKGRLKNIFLHPYSLPAGLYSRAFNKYVDHRQSLWLERSKEFQDNLIHLQDMEYSHSDELLQDPPIYDAYVAGSDQIWHPTGHYGENAYFLEFSPKERRIAYAPSVGVSEIPEESIDWLCSGVKGIPYLSVREKTGSDLLKQHCGCNAQVVVDPTLLLSQEDWLKISSSYQIEGPYVVMYALEGDKYVRQQALNLCRKLNYKLVILPIHPRDVWIQGRRIIKAYDAGPREFIDLIRKSAFVITDSFHGTVFSIIFQRNFYTFRRYGKTPGSATFSRMNDLLSRIGLSNRLIDRDSNQIQGNDEMIDFTKVIPLLDSWIEDSRFFLKESLQHAVNAR